MNEKQKTSAVQEVLAKSLDRLEKAFADFKIPEFLASFQREAGTRLTFVDQISKGRDLPFGPCIEEDLLMHDPSSGDESEESGSIFKLPPKLSEVLNVVYDPRRRIEEAIPGLKLYLMFSGLDGDTNPKNFYESVLQIAERVNPNIIVDCVKMLEFGQQNQRAIVEFKDDSHCSSVYSII